MSNLNEKAMLIELSISQWSGRKLDRKITQEVNAAHNADENAGRYNKSLIAKDVLQKIKKAANSARTYHYKNTLPWSDNSPRILPAAHFQDYSAEMRKLKASFEDAVQEFVSNYPDYVYQARSMLNGMFNADDYPADVEDKFSFNTEILPLPAAGDFRVTLQGGEVARIQQDIENRCNAAMERAMKDLWSRLFEAVKHMAEKLGDTDKVFRNSLVNNLCELTAILPKMNITGNADLEKMRREIEDKLCGLEPDELRKDPEQRKQTAQDASAILETMAGYIGG